MKNCAKEIILEKERGTKLLKNDNSPLLLEIFPLDSTNKLKVGEILVIKENLLTQLEKIGTISEQGYILEIKEGSEYQIMNTNNYSIKIQFDKAIDDHEIIYDPYYYEEETHKDIDSSEILRSYDIPDGYLEILPKWYSIKFTYPDYNLIIVRPNCGISLQTHTLREEHWEIVKGNPIIISSSKVSYNTPDGMKFIIPIKEFHTVINSSKSDYAMIKEKCTGEFDEKDIVRIFNPNHYF